MLAIVMQLLATVGLGVTLIRIAQVVRVGQTWTTAAHQAIAMRHLATVVPDAIYKVIVQVAIAGPSMTTAAHHQDIVMQHPATVVPGVALTGSVQAVRVGPTMTTAAQHQAIVMQHLATVVPGVIQPVIVRVVIAGKTWTTAVAPPQEITLSEHTSGCCREEYLLLQCPLYRAR